MKEIVERYVSIWNSKDHAELDDVFVKESKYWDAMQAGDAIEVLRNSILATHKAFPDVSFQIVSIDITDNYQCFLEWQMTGTNTGEFYGAEPTGNRVQIMGLDSIRFESNRIVGFKSFYDSSLLNP